MIGRAANLPKNLSNNVGMRLTPAEHHAVLEAVAASDPEAEVWLHGSRARDDALGGDIDILVMSQRIGMPEKLDVLTRLRRALGERKIDLTIARDERQPFVRVARMQGKRL